jgi:hypothetical protein
MKKQCILMMVLTCLILSFPSPLLFSKEQYFVGCIDDMRGDVQIFKDSKNFWVPAQKLVPVEEKDIIKTGKLSFCRLVLDDGSAFRLDADSQLNLKELKIDKSNNAKVQTYHLKLDFGTLLSVFNKKSGASAKFKVSTPVAVMSIRGTDFAVSVKGNDTKVGLFEGEMAVASPENENKEVILKPDQEADISKGSEPKKNEYLSSTMQKEKVRCQKLKEYAEAIRKKLQEHGNYLQDKMNQREKSLQQWEQRRRDKIDGIKTEQKGVMDQDVVKSTASVGSSKETETPKPVEAKPAEIKKEESQAKPETKTDNTNAGSLEQKPADNQGTK